MQTLPAKIESINGDNPPHFQFRQFANRYQQAIAAAEWLAEHLEHSHKNNTRIALAGGKTPIPVYEILAKKPLDWSNSQIMPTDERCVPPTHPRSNLAMLKQTLGADKNYTPLVAGKTVQGLDIVLLGAGADGHIASLFPDTPLDKKAQTVQRVHPASQPEPRLTLPLSCLQWASRLLLLICGQDKLQMLLNTPHQQPMTLAHLQKMRTLQQFADHDIYFGKTSPLPLSHLFAARQQRDGGLKQTAIYYAD